MSLRDLPAAQTVVSCGGDHHRIRWEAGELRALDHDDADAERTLAALGGERCTCVDLLDAWERHRDDLSVLVLAARGPADVLAPQQEFPGYTHALLMPRRRAAFATATQSVTSYAVGAPSSPSPRDNPEQELIALLLLGGGIPERLVATVAEAWRERAAEPDAGARLHAALYGRVLVALHSLLGASPPRLELTMVDETAQPRLASVDGCVQAELPFGWLVDVWAHGLALVFGRFCVSARSEDGRAWSLETVGPDLGPGTRISVQLQ